MNNNSWQSFASTETKSGHIIGTSGLYAGKMMGPPCDPSVHDVMGLHRLQIDELFNSAWYHGVDQHIKASCVYSHPLIASHNHY